MLLGFVARRLEPCSPTRSTPGWVGGFMYAGLARLARLARFAGRFGFLALLEAGLKHVVSHARRQDGSADFKSSIISTK